MSRVLYLVNLQLFYTLLTLCSVDAIAQEYPYELKKYNFINYNANILTIYDSLQYKKLFSKFTSVGLKGQGQVSILHIGDSHIQADFLSGQFRRKLQTFFIGSQSGRGFIFPYAVAKTNNPLNYKVKYTGNWSSCKNVDKKKKCPLGLSGITIFTKDSVATISISINDPKLPGYDFDRLMIFHAFGDSCVLPEVKNRYLKSVKRFPEQGYSLFEFSQSITSMTLYITNTQNQQNGFYLYGFNFDSNDSEIIYHTVGVNGAKYESFLKCDYFGKQLSVLNPDWIIVSLGTNDSYTYSFDSVKTQKNIEQLITIIRQSAPDAAILLTTPGDNRIHKKDANKSVAVVGQIIKRTAKKYNLSYWDYYTVMGGFGSINYWYYENLAHTDYVHYTPQGYSYQADLLFNAFLKSYDKYIITEIQKKISPY